MKYGHFDDETREYVITRPDTPLPWINYIGCQDYFGILSATAGGYSYFRDARKRRITRGRYNNVPLDFGGRYIYLRDNESGDTWSPSWMPTQSALNSFECRHGMGYSVISSKKAGIAASTRYFVPLDETLEIWQLTLTNERAEEAELSVFSAVEFCLWEANDDATNFQRNFNTGEVEVEDGVIYHKTEYRERRNHFAWFACSEKLAGFDTQRESFLGPWRGWDRPQAVASGQATDSIAHGWSPIGSHHVKVTLKPGESRQIVFALGYHENPQDQKFDPPDRQVINKRLVKPTIARYRDPAEVDAAFAKLSAYWDGLLGIYQVTSPDEHTDRMVNAWNAYQCMATFNMSRSASTFESGIGRGLGFRDSNQDLLGFVHMVPERARQRILDLAATQLASGGAYHQYQPMTKKGNDAVGGNFNDDPHWLIVGVAQYLKETGDFSILDEKVPFDSTPGTEVPLYEHLRRSIQYALDRLGPHRLPLIGRADWNDCLNLNCFSSDPDESFQTTTSKDGKVAESVFIAGLFVLAAKELAAIADERGAGGDAETYRAEAAKMEETVRQHGWDGEWFVRAYDDFGRKVGSKDCEEGKIFIEPQGFCVLAGIGLNDGMARQGARCGGQAPRHAARHRGASAGLYALLHRIRRDLDLPAGLQGKRQHLLPQQSVGDDRRDDAGQRRGGVRLLQPHQSVGARGVERGASLRALRLCADDRRARRAHPRRGQELVAHRHRGMELLCRHAMDPRHQAGLCGLAHRPGGAGKLAGLHRPPTFPRRHLRCHGQACRPRKWGQPQGRRQENRRHAGAAAGQGHEDGHGRGGDRVSFGGWERTR